MLDTWACGGRVGVIAAAREISLWPARAASSFDMQVSMYSSHGTPPAPKPLARSRCTLSLISRPLLGGASRSCAMPGQAQSRSKNAVGAPLHTRLRPQRAHHGFKKRCLKPYRNHMDRNGNTSL